MHWGWFCVDANTSSFGLEDPRPGSRACVCACSSWPGRAGRSPGRVLVRLIFSCGRSWWAVCLFGPLWARVPLCAVAVGFFFFFFPCCAPAVSGVSCFLARGALWPGRLVVLRPPLAFSFALLSLVFVGSQPGVPWALALCGPPGWPSSLPFFCFSFLHLSSPPPVFFCFFFLSSSCFLFVSCFFFPFLFPLLPFFVLFSVFFSSALVCRLCGSRAGLCVVSLGFAGVCCCVSLGAP